LNESVLNSDNASVANDFIWKSGEPEEAPASWHRRRPDLHRPLSALLATSFDRAVKAEL